MYFILWSFWYDLICFLVQKCAEFHKMYLRNTNTQIQKEIIRLYKSQGHKVISPWPHCIEHCKVKIVTHQVSILYTSIVNIVEFTESKGQGHPTVALTSTIFTIFFM